MPKGPKNTSRPNWKGLGEMEYGDLIKSGIGAFIGFFLAQLVNLARLIWEWWNRPRLAIYEIGDNNILLSHTVEAANHEYYKEKRYGFYVRNAGRRAATGIRFQIIKIEYRGKEWPEFAVSSEHAYELALYGGQHVRSRDTETVLVPGATAVIDLAGWREDYDVIFPSVTGLPDYYEEICSGADEYRFTVVAFDDKARYVQKVITVN
jgi:hypothetical protein